MPAVSPTFTECTIPSVARIAGTIEGIIFVCCALGIDVTIIMFTWIKYYKNIALNSDTHRRHKWMRKTFLTLFRK